MIQALLTRPNTSGGAFNLQIDASSISYRIIEAGVRFRSRVMGRPYGDQAIFMTKDIFRSCGGFPDLSHMEDYVMLHKLKKHGVIRVLPASVRTSARRWQREGVVRTTVGHQWLILKHRCHIFEMHGESYRFRESAKTARERKTRKN